MKKTFLFGVGAVNNSELTANYERLLAFIATFIIFLVAHQFYDISKFYWDAGGYWDLSQLQMLFDFPNEIRGYFYPALLSPIRFLEDTFPAAGHLPFRVISSLVYALVFSQLLPEFFHTLFGGQLSIRRRLVVPILLSILMPGVLIYPLSDLAALALSFSAAWCVLRAQTARKAVATILLFLAGILSYGAYNTRTIYIFPAALLLLAIMLLLFKGIPAPRRAVLLGTFIGGVAIACIPQSLINVRHHHVVSPAVITNGSGSNSLFAAQLLWGITAQKYETSVNPASPGAGLFYMDRAGEKFFADHQIDGRNFKVTTYIGLMLEKPFFFMGLLGRHFVNGLDVRDGLVYSQGDSVNRNVISFINFIVVFFGFCVIGHRLAFPFAFSQPTVRALLWSAYFLLPVAAIVPSALETRFFLPLHLTLYAFIAYKADLELFRLMRRLWFAFILVFLLSAIEFFAISQATMAGLEYSYSDSYRGL